MNNLIIIAKNNIKIIRFCVTVILLLVFFNYADYYVFRQSETHQILIDFLGKTSVFVYRFLGYDYRYVNSEIFEGNDPLLMIGFTCDGLSFMTMFLAFVLAYPIQKPLRKIWFILFGIVVIHLLNTIRVLLLIMNVQVSYSTFDFNHKYTFIVIVYGIVLWMWMIWAKRNAIKN